jgi:hypothetical protein
MLEFHGFLFFLSFFSPKQAKAQTVQIANIRKRIIVLKIHSDQLKKFEKLKTYKIKSNVMQYLSFLAIIQLLSICYEVD